MWMKGDLSDSECGMVVGARQTSAADLLGSSSTVTSQVYREWSEKEVICGEQEFSGQRSEEKGQTGLG